MSALLCLVFANLLTLATSVGVERQSDINLYQAISTDFISGVLPYRDRLLEYPPYSMFLFLPPLIFGHREFYHIYFECFMLVGDLWIKVLLFLYALRGKFQPNGIRPLFFFIISVPFLKYFYLQRFDVWPALITLIAIIQFCSGRKWLSGLLLGLSIGIKLYPIVFIPIMIAAAGNRTRLQFLGGLVLSLLPIAILSFYLPWWTFLSFHAERGIQVESLYAAILWLGQHAGLVEVKWSFEKAWYEVKGPLASSALPYLRILWMLATSFSIAVASAAMLRKEAISPFMLARAMLLPIVAFVIFNSVFTHQFIIWLLPLAALSILEKDPFPAIGISIAAMLTPFIFPSLTGNYYADSGLNVYETLILLIRNVILLAVWIDLLWVAIRTFRQDSSIAKDYKRNDY